jgi:O-antigen/teichoic acid export membrane protein
LRPRVSLERRSTRLVSSGADGVTDSPSPTSVLDETTAGGKVIRGSLLRSLSYAASVGLGILSAALMTRHLGVVDFGRYVTVVSIVTLAIGMSDVGMSNIGVREYSVREGGDRDRTMRNVFGLRIALTGVAVVLAIGFAAIAGYPQVMVVGTLVATLGYVLTTVQHSLAVPLSAGLRLGWVASLDVLRQAGLVLVVVVLVLSGAGLLAFLAAPLPAAVFVLAVTAWLVRGSIPFVPAFHPRAWGRLLRIVLPYAAASAVGAVYVSLVVVVTSLVATQQETGYFGAAFRVFSVLSAIPGLLIASAFPVLARAARDDRERLRYVLQRLWDASLVLGAGVAVLTAVGAPVAIRVVAGPDFEPSVSVLRIQAGALFASFFIAIWGYALLSLAAYRSLLVANAVALVLAGGLALALAPEYGADGAAVATLVGELGLAVALGLLLMRVHEDLRVDPEILPRVVVAAALGMAVLLIPGLPDVVDLVLAASLYLVAIVALRAVPDEVWAALRHREPLE